MGTAGHLIDSLFEPNPADLSCPWSQPMSRRDATRRDTTPRDATRRHATPLHSTPLRSAPRHTTLLHATLRHAMPRRAASRRTTRSFSKIRENREGTEERRNERPRNTRADRWL